MTRPKGILEAEARFKYALEVCEIAEDFVQEKLAYAPDLSRNDRRVMLRRLDELWAWAAELGRLVYPQPVPKERKNSQRLV